MLLFVQRFAGNKDSLFHFGLIRSINPLIILGIAVIIFTDMLALYSAAGGRLKPWAVNQLIHFLIFLPLGVLIAICNPNFLSKCSIPLYILSVLLLVLVKFFGYKTMGAQRWLDLGIIKLQPSELAKVSLIMMLAQYFNVSSFNFIQSYKGLVIPTLITALPLGLICIQPDLATSITLAIIACTMIFLSGIRLKVIIILSVIATISAPFAWLKLHTYQKQRIVNFIMPENDPLNSGYNIIQSKIAIGSGGLFGQGLVKGAQAQLNFLPESQTDFIFTIIAEETGFIGCMVIILLYSSLIIYGIIVAQNTKNNFLKMISLGSSTFFFAHVFINMAMTMGLLPAAGIPLPMFSYGGTVMGISIILIAFMINADLSTRIKR